jgi:hypothetical protein
LPALRGEQAAPRAPGLVPTPNGIGQLEKIILRKEIMSVIFSTSERFS